MPGPFQRKPSDGGVRSFGPRNALRPVPERTVRPHVDLADVADRAGRTRIRPRSARRPRSGPGCPSAWRRACSAPCVASWRASATDQRQRLLHVHVLAEIHRRQRDRRVHVIGRRDDDRVDVLLPLEHLAIVLIALRARQMLGLQAPHARDLRRHPLSLGGGERRLGPALRVHARLVRGRSSRSCWLAMSASIPLKPVSA